MPPNKILKSFYTYVLKMRFTHIIMIGKYSDLPGAFISQNYMKIW